MKKAIIGYGGHAREVAAQMGTPVTFFVDDEYVNEHTKPISELDHKKYEVMVAIADPQKRSEITKRLPKDIKFFTFVHSTSLLMDNIEIGEGSFIGAYSILTTNIQIGKHAILNRANQIGHDCRIGDFFSAMPGAIVGGNVNIGDRVYLGSAANIKEKIEITRDVTIGMNSGVIRHLMIPGGTYVGTPPKIIGNIFAKITRIEEI